MPEIDDWGYDEWADAAQRGLSAEASQRRYEQSLGKYGQRQQKRPRFEFVELDSQELLESRTRARDAWDSYRADISRQVEQCYAAKRATDSTTPDAEEIEGLAYWDKNSRLLVLEYGNGFRQIYAMMRGKELFEDGKGIIVSAKKEN